MSIPLQFCDHSFVMLWRKMHMYNSCEARVRIAHPLMGEALRPDLPRKIGGGQHTLIYPYFKPLFCLLTNSVSLL